MARLAAWRADPVSFRRPQIILENGRCFGEAVDPFQVEDFSELDRHRHAYLERPRGHSKTGDLGTEGLTRLILGRPGSLLYCSAADEDQARLLFDDVVQKSDDSTLLGPLVKITRREIVVKATGSRLIVLNGDAPSSYGLVRT